MGQMFHVACRAQVDAQHLHAYSRFLRPGQGNTPSSSRGRRSPHPIASARTWVVENLTCEHVANIVSFGGFVRVDRAVPRRTGGDLAVNGWEPQPAASVFLPNIARLSSTAAHYESDRTNRNERFAARHGRFRPQAVQEPETAAGGEILRRQTQCRQTGPPPFLPGPIT